MIVRIEDFKGEATIAGIYRDSNIYDARQNALADVLNEYIEKYEPMLLEMLFDVEDIEAINTYAENGCDDDERMNNVLRMLRCSISHFVAFYFMRRQMMTPIGAINAQGDEGVKVTSCNQLVLLWNQMVDNNMKLHNYYYHTSRHPYNDAFAKINQYNF